MRPKRLASDKGARGEEASNPASRLPPEEVLNALPERVRVSVIEAASFSGPLPPPTMYGEYERTLPGSAERILVMAEKEQDHRIEWERAEQKTDKKETNLGQWLGFAIAVACIGAGTFLAMNGHDLVAVVAFGFSAVGLVGRFLRR